jgi:antirestriction protein ArdC
MEKVKIDMSGLLAEAVSKPGMILEAYSAFTGRYSIGNRLWAMRQCVERGIPVAPIGTFKFWESKGRRVKKGEKALSLLVPVKIKKKDENGEETDESFMLFRAVNRFFTMHQTEGENYIPESFGEWNRDTALKNLNINLVTFEHMNGNVQGYASGRDIAINPMAQLPHKTLFHEIAHVILGHTDVEAHDSFNTPKNIKEVEAESVALICCEALKLEGAEYCRGYIQSWLGENNSIAEKSAKKIFAAANKILEAGYFKGGSEDEE